MSPIDMNSSHPSSPHAFGRGSTWSAMDSRLHHSGMTSSINKTTHFSCNDTEAFRLVISPHTSHPSSPHASGRESTLLAMDSRLRHSGMTKVGLADYSKSSFFTAPSTEPSALQASSWRGLVQHLFRSSYQHCRLSS